ncbi:DUF1173 domain-containing protein [Streptomyces mayteni]
MIRVRAGRYHLAGWPGDGEQHASHCPFHKIPPSLSGRSHYTNEAIHDDEAGTSIRLAHPLTTRMTPSRRHTTSRPSGGEPGTARRAVGLLGLLHFLWEQTQLNQWHPFWHRSWSTCRSRLHQAADDCVINGQRLREALHVIPPYQPANARANAAEFANFRARLGERRGIEQRGLLLGELKEATETPHGVRYRLRHLPRPMFASTTLAERAQRSYRAALSAAAADVPCRRMVLLLVRTSAKGYLVADDLAAMLTTNTYVPADSSHEIHMADALTAAERSFVKPLRYDASDAVFPDFVLTDDPAGPMHVEVYGMSNLDSYRQRKRVKQAHYRARRIPVIEWDVANPLPSLARRTRLTT